MFRLSIKIVFTLSILVLVACKVNSASDLEPLQDSTLSDYLVSSNTIFESILSNDIPVKIKLVEIRDKDDNCEWLIGDIDYSTSVKEDACPTSNLFLVISETEAGGTSTAFQISVGSLWQIPAVKDVQRKSMDTWSFRLWVEGHVLVNSKLVLQTREFKIYGDEGIYKVNSSTIQN